MHTVGEFTIMNVSSRFFSNVLYGRSRRSAKKMAALVTLLMICTPVAVQCQNLTDSQVELISVSLADAAKASWELGTRAQAILSLNATGFSVYSSTSLPPPTSIEQFGDGNATGLAPLFDIARTTVLNRGASNGNVTGPQPLMKDGSAADPASIGFAVLLANWTQQDESTVDYVGAAKDQLDFLYQVVPKTSDGAFSHRVAEVQLWSDFVYMVPPFLAYYGVLTRNRTLLLEAYNQIKLYRNYLRDSHAGGLWKHVLLGASGNDEGHWSTGNAWAAAGMLRVLATFQHSEYANTLKHQQNDLAGWAIEIQNAMYTHLDNTLVFANYPDLAPDTPGNFYDASSTALLASTVYRVSLLWGEHSHLPIAERSRQALFGPSSSSATPTFTSDSPISSTSNSTASNSTTTNSTTANTVLSNMAHFTTEGYLTPVVNPHSYGREGSKSAEAQAFVVELHSAWRDWIADGAKGANGARRTMGWPVIPLYGWVAWACILLGGWLV